MAEREIQVVNPAMPDSGGVALLEVTYLERQIRDKMSELQGYVG
jgi:hypothetical protein